MLPAVQRVLHTGPGCGVGHGDMYHIFAAKCQGQYGARDRQRQNMFPLLIAVLDAAEEVALSTAPVQESEPPEPVSTEVASSRVDSVRNAVLNALADAGHRMLVSMLETGEWSIEDSEVVIKVAASATVTNCLGASPVDLIMAG